MTTRTPNFGTPLHRSHVSWMFVMQWPGPVLRGLVLLSRSFPAARKRSHSYTVWLRALRIRPPIKQHCTEMYLHLTTTFDEWKFPASSSSYHNAPTPRPSNTTRNSILARQCWSSPTHCEFLSFLTYFPNLKNMRMISGAGIAQSL
jgi:hypothetical protein